MIEHTWKIGDKVISNIGLDRDKLLTIVDIGDNYLFFDDNEGEALSKITKNNLKPYNEKIKEWRGLI